MKKILIFAFLTSCIFLFVACQQKVDWKGQIEEVNGVLVVSNPEEPIYENAITLDEELTIGLEEGADGYLFAAIGHIWVDDEGNIIVSDSIESVVKVFDAEGRFLSTIGKKGQGPGEFSRIDSLRVTPEGELLVIDNVSRRLSYFKMDGELVDYESFQLRAPASSNWQVDKRGNVILDTARFTEDNHLVVETKIYDSQHQFVKVLYTAKPYDLTMPFSPFYYWRLTALDSIVCASNDRYELEAFSPEWELVKRIRKDYSPVKIRKEEIKEELRRKRLPPDTKIPEFHPAFHIFVVDDVGRIYVRTWERYEDGELYYYDVFDADGRYFTRFPFHITPRVIKEEKLYTVEEDEEGFHIIKRYRMQWTHDKKE